MKIKLIAAIDRQGAIGVHNQMPWHLPDDLRFFKAQTQGGVVVMGRKTFESLGNRPLPNRRNIVLTRQHDWQATDVEVMHDWSVVQAQLRAEHIDTVWVIGGGLIYDACITQATHLVLTRVDTQVPQADAFFPAWDEAQWQLVDEQLHATDAHHAYAFSWQIWVRK